MDHTSTQAITAKTIKAEIARCSVAVYERCVVRSVDELISVKSE